MPLIMIHYRTILKESLLLKITVKLFAFLRQGRFKIREFNLPDGSEWDRFLREKVMFINWLDMEIEIMELTSTK